MSRGMHEGATLAWEILESCGIFRCRTYPQVLDLVHLQQSAPGHHSPKFSHNIKSLFRALAQGPFIRSRAIAIGVVGLSLSQMSQWA
jgi:hypothetical protein